jgi:HK97 gp10 family phage protein
MSNDTYGYDGFQELSDMLEKYIANTNNVMDVLESGAKEFVNDLLKLPKPISKIRKAGYTHLVNSFSYRKKNNEIEVGWGKYYGPMLENGTTKMKAQPHIYPLWEKNKEKYYKTMLTKLELEN